MRTGLCVRLIPCLDIMCDQVVKGTNFKSLIKLGNPSLMSNDYSLNGADELCFLNVDTSRFNKSILYQTVTSLAENCFVPLILGGGIRNIDDISALLSAGADKVSINTASLFNVEFIGKCVDKFGSQCIVASVDCKFDGFDWKVYTHGGNRPSGVCALEHIYNVVQYGAGEVLLSSIDFDGTKNGYDIALLNAVSQTVSVPIIASGGAGLLRHLASALIEGHCSAVLLASTLHCNFFSLAQLKFFLNSCGILTRASYDTDLYDE